MFPKTAAFVLLLSIAAANRAGQPATVVGQIKRVGKPSARARVEFTPLSPRPRNPGLARRVIMTNAAGGFVCVALPPAARYEVRVTFADGLSSWGFRNDVRPGEVRHISTRVTPCGTTNWYESELGAEQSVYVWLLRIVVARPCREIDPPSECTSGPWQGALRP